MVPLCLSGYFVGPKFFHEYFVSSNIFLIGISWVLNFFSWVFRGSSIFYRGYFVGPKFFLVSISWIQIFFSGVFHGSNFFLVANFMIQDFQLFAP